MTTGILIIIRTIIEAILAATFLMCTVYLMSKFDKCMDKYLNDKMNG